MHEETTTREKILKKVRKALIEKVVKGTNIDFESNIFVKTDEPLEILFAQQFTKLNGKFCYCENEKEFLSQLSDLIKEQRWENIFCFEKNIHNFLDKAAIPYSDKEKDISHSNVSISLCEYLAARTGSVLISSKQSSGRCLPAFGNYHVVIAFTSQLVYGIQEALEGLKKRYKNNYPSLVMNISGPSRTADIEKTLVQGAHGPKEIYVFLVEK